VGRQPSGVVAAMFAAGGQGGTQAGAEVGAEAVDVIVAVAVDVLLAAALGEWPSSGRQGLGRSCCRGRSRSRSF